jgi:2-C-methyl-D-erythritol 4-phosphate cytidylyltransferase/2-C-methyl-D-erythritol 2,4-cyclodiphosphate synthase
VDTNSSLFEDRFADAVIVAAGSSTRMGGVDKLMEPLNGKPLLQWTVEAMERAESVVGVIVVTRADRVDELRRFPWLEGVRVVAGGAERSDSVRAGLNAVSEEFVLGHDGARPFASSVLADSVARATFEHGAAVPAVPVADSLKRTEGARLLGSVDRDGLVRTQTPQGARRDLLIDALARAGKRSYTDEAQLLEAAGFQVVTVPGDPANIKITDAHDLEMARALARGLADERLGYGEDTHGFGPEDGLMLGGILIEGAPRLYGHSDGDVVLHALATAVLSASEIGDLGRLFPSNDPQTAGIASIKLLGEAVERAEAAGWLVDRAHVSIVGARPKLGAERLDAMRKTIAILMGVVREESVAVVASSGNLSGPEGAGSVIRATALVTVVRR